MWGVQTSSLNIQAICLVVSVSLGEWQKPKFWSGREFPSDRKKYEHTFIISYQNKDAVTLQPTSFTYTNTRTQPMSTSSTASTHTTIQHTTTIQTPTTPATTTIRTIATHTLSITKHTSSAFSTTPPSTTSANTENEILKNVKHSIQKKISFTDMKIQHDLIDFLMSPSGTKLSRNEINSFYHKNKNLNF